RGVFLLDETQPAGPSREALAAESRQIASTFGDALQLPALLRTLPPQVQALTIVPDDSLHGFPFAAIVHEGKYLAERYALSVAFESGPVPPPRARRTQGPALVVGVSHGADGFAPLPGTQRELEGVA